MAEIRKQTKRVLKKELTKSAFRTFNRKTDEVKRNVLLQIIKEAIKDGKAYIDGMDNVVISHTVVEKVVIIVIPLDDVVGWCGNEPRPIRFPITVIPVPLVPADPEPGPDCGPRRPRLPLIPRPVRGPKDPCPTYLVKADRETLCKYVAAQLGNDKSQLNMVATGSCLHSIQLGEDKVSILVAGKL